MPNTWNQSDLQTLNHIKIPANQTYKPADGKVPGDFSSAAFLLAAAAITNSKVKIDNLDYTLFKATKPFWAFSSRWVLTEKSAQTASKSKAQAICLKL